MRYFLGINLLNYVKNLCSENYKTLLREIKECLNKCQLFLYSWVIKLNTVLISTLSKLTFILFIYLYWSTIALQCCVSFCCSTR